MKIALIIIGAAGLVLWTGYAIGYHYGVRDTDARWKTEYTITEIKTTHITSENRAPQMVISPTNISQ